MKYTQQFRSYWQPFCDDEYWKDKPISISQESLSTLLKEVDRLTAYAHRLLSDESRTWHCDGCGHNFTSKAMAEGKAFCPLCDAPMRPMSEIRQERIAELEAELEKHRWMPVSERLPEYPEFNPRFEGVKSDGINVLAIGMNMTRGWETHYDKERGFCFWNYDMERLEEFGEGDITHWQYLPEPPKEGEKTKDTILEILQEEDIRLIDGRYSNGFVDAEDLQKLIDEGKVFVYESQSVKFVSLTSAEDA